MAGEDLRGEGAAPTNTGESLACCKLLYLRAQHATRYSAAVHELKATRPDLRLSALDTSEDALNWRVPMQNA